MHNVYVDRVDIFEKLKQHSGGHWPILIFTRGEWERHDRGHADLHTPRPTTQRPVTPRPTTQAPQPTRIKVISTISLLVHGKHHHIPGYVDFRQGGGEISFRFRTLLPTGLLLTIPRTTTLSHFMSFEVFDGKLYFVYDFGALTRRVLVSNDFVSTGQWQNVKLSMADNYILVYLNSKPTRIELSSFETNSLYFAGGIWIGALPAENLSWYTFARDGYVGCIGDLTLHKLGEWNVYLCLLNFQLFQGCILHTILPLTLLYIFSLWQFSMLFWSLFSFPYRFQHATRVFHLRIWYFQPVLGAHPPLWQCQHLRYRNLRVLRPIQLHLPLWGDRIRWRPLRRM